MGTRENSGGRGTGDRGGRKAEVLKGLEVGNK